MTVLTITLYATAVVLGVWAVTAPVSQLLHTSASATVALPVDPSDPRIDLPETRPLRDVSFTPVSVGFPAGPAVMVTATAGTAPATCCGTGTAAPAPWLLRFLTDLPTAVWAGALAVITFLFARIVSAVAANHPFHRDQPRRWTLIAVLVLVASIAADALNVITTATFVNTYDLPHGATYPITVPWLPLGLAAMALVLAAAFRAGRQLADDTDGLV